MFTRVLVATDFSEPSRMALDYGRRVAALCCATLHVLHVSDDIRWRYSLDMTPALLAGVQEDLEAGARTRLEALLSVEDRERLRAVASVCTSPMAADAIVDYAREVSADLIVVGGYGRSGGAPRPLGSVAERVLGTAPCPVLSVRAVPDLRPPAI